MYIKRIYLLLLTLIIVIFICPLSSCREELYEIYEYRALLSANEPYIEEYPHWRDDVYQFATPEEELEITFNGVTYKGVYDSESKARLEIVYGIEALNNYKIYDGEERVGNVDINDKSGDIQEIRFAVDVEAVYNAPELSDEERLGVADSLAGQYIDVDDYHFSSKQLYTHKVKYDSDETVILYEYTYYKNVNGVQCEYDKIIIEMYQDGTVRSMELKELGSIDKDSVLVYDNAVLLETVTQKLKGTERYLEYSEGDFDFVVNAFDPTYYVFEDGEIGMYVDMYVTIVPHNGDVPLKTDRLIYIVKINK